MAKKMGMSIRAYAQYRGVAHRSVQFAIENGRIKTLPDGSIDKVQADRDWEDNTDFSKVHSLKSSAFSDAKTLKMKSDAMLAQMKVKEAIGAIVPTDEVIVFMRVLTTDLANSFLFLGRNIAPRLVNEKDIVKITRIIDDEIKRLIKEYKNDIEGRISKQAESIMDSKDN